MTDISQSLPYNMAEKQLA